MQISIFSSTTPFLLWLAGADEFQFRYAGRVFRVILGARACRYIWSPVVCAACLSCLMRANAFSLARSLSQSLSHNII